MCALTWAHHGNYYKFVTPQLTIMQLQFRPGAALGTHQHQFCSKFGFCLQIRSISQHILNCLNLVIGDKLRTRYISVLSLRTIFYPQNYNYASSNSVGTWTLDRGDTFLLSSHKPDTDYGDWIRERGPACSTLNNGKEVPRWGVVEIQKMSPSTTGRCYCCH